MDRRAVWRAAWVVLAVSVISAGYVKLEDNQRTTDDTAARAKITASKLDAVVVGLQAEAKLRCNAQNAGYDAERSILAYLKSRQASLQAFPLTEDQVTTFNAAIALVPPNQRC